MCIGLVSLIAITECCTLYSLETAATYISQFQRLEACHQSVPACLDSGDSPLLSCRFSCCVLTWQKESERGVWCLFDKGANPVEEGSTFMT